MIDWLNDNSGFAASIAAFLSFLTTALLVVVTLLYTRHTRRIAEGANEPAIRCWLYPHDASTFFLRIVNCGSGSATDIDVSLWYGGATSPCHWTWPYLRSGESQEFKFPDPTTGAPIFLASKIAGLDKLRMKAAYRAVDGRSLKAEQVVDLRESVGSSVAVGMMVTEDHPDRILISIRDEIRAISQAARRPPQEGTQEDPP